MASEIKRTEEQAVVLRAVLSRLVIRGGRESSASFMAWIASFQPDCLFETQIEQPSLRRVEESAFRMGLRKSTSDSGMPIASFG